MFVWDLRLIRQQLKELGMDWDWHEFPPSDDEANSGPSKVEVHLRRPPCPEAGLRKTVPVSVFRVPESNRWPRENGPSFCFPRARK